ncbi:MAG: dolichyl-phosphate beta-glucosyltransferase [Myxococcota bacterium]|jgi:dolichyl-phosphate beta-glucosyltransferase
MTTRTTIVVPCYNEAERFDNAAFDRALQEIVGLDFLFVNDGSTDNTLPLLQEFASKHEGRVRVLALDHNQGKSLAVRYGMLEAFSGDVSHCGYWDADLATPLDEIPRFVDVLNAQPTLDLVIGSRVKLLGRSISRDPMRHYLGRIAATVASLVLDLPVYDTQCGAKVFRNSTEMRQLFEAPMKSGWVFDVEVIARLIRQRKDAGRSSAEHVIYELPLLQWHDVAGSKIRPNDYAKAFVDVIKVYLNVIRG